MYINCREDTPQRVALIETGNPQPRTPMQTNNLALQSVIKQILSKNNKGDVNMFPLDEVLRRPRVLQVLLDTGQTELR